MIVFVYGYEGSGEGHWQRWAAGGARRPRRFRRVPRALRPGRAGKGRLGRRAARRRRPRAPPRRAGTFLCHSLGCWALDHYLDAHGPGRTCTPRCWWLRRHRSSSSTRSTAFSLLRVVRRRGAPFAARTLLVGSDNDDYAGPDELADVARQLGIPCTILPGAGHINIAAGYGAWPFVLEWVARWGAYLASGCAWARRQPGTSAGSRGRDGANQPLKATSEPCHRGVHRVAAH
jgi:predicted alpha/beta hydrolase family esterase